MNIAKINQKLPFYHNIICHFQLVMRKWFIFWSQSRFIKVNIGIVVTTTVIYWVTAQEHGVDMIMTPFQNSVGIRIVSMMNYHMKINITRGGGYCERIR